MPDNPEFVQALNIESDCFFALLTDTG
jgi:hypothetical protein